MLRFIGRILIAWLHVPVGDQIRKGGAAGGVFSYVDYDQCCIACIAVSAVVILVVVAIPGDDEDRDHDAGDANGDEWDDDGGGIVVMCVIILCLYVFAIFGCTADVFGNFLVIGRGRGHVYW